MMPAPAETPACVREGEILAGSLIERVLGVARALELAGNMRTLFAWNRSAASLCVLGFLACGGVSERTVTERTSKPKPEGAGASIHGNTSADSNATTRQAGGAHNQ